jgi:hypothetical protein
VKPESGVAVLSCRERSVAARSTVPYPFGEVHLA